MRRLGHAAIALTLAACSATPPRITANAPLPTDVTITVVLFAPPAKVLSFDGPTDAPGARFVAAMIDTGPHREATLDE